MHHAVGAMLRTQLKQANDVGAAVELADNILASCQHAIRASAHRTLRMAPGSFVFQRDMVSPVPVVADTNLTCQRRQAATDETDRRANLRRQFKDCHINDQVMIKRRGRVLVSGNCGNFPLTSIRAHLGLIHD